MIVGGGNHLREPKMMTPGILRAQHYWTVKGSEPGSQSCIGKQGMKQDSENAESV